MRAFLTGGTGFIGGRVAAALRERGDEVVALVRTPARADALERLGCTLVGGDLDDRDAIRRGVEGCDAAFHAAAVYRVGVPASERAAILDINVGGTERVLDAAIEAGVARIVHVSTINAFGNTGGRVVDETYARPPGGFLSVYDESKYLAHQAALERIGRGAPVIIVQPCAVYGPGDHSELGTIVEQAHSGRLRFVSFPSMGVAAAHVDDIAAGIVLAHDRGRIGEAYVLGGEITTMRGLVTAAAAAGGRRPPRLSMPGFMIKASVPIAPLVTRSMGLPPNLRELIRASDGVTYWARDDKARAELGYQARDLRAGMSSTFSPS